MHLFCRIKKAHTHTLTHIHSKTHTHKHTHTQTHTHLHTHSHTHTNTQRHTHKNTRTHIHTHTQTHTHTHTGSCSSTLTYPGHVDVRCRAAHVFRTGERGVLCLCCIGALVFCVERTLHGQVKGACCADVEVLTLPQ